MSPSDEKDEPAPGQSADATADSSDSQRIARIGSLLEPLTDDAIRFFAARTQHELTRLTRRISSQVADSSIAGAGDSLQRIIDSIRGFDIEALDPNRKAGWFARLFGRGNSLRKFITAYRHTGHEIDVISRDLDREQTALLTDIVLMKKLYEKVRLATQELSVHKQVADDTLASIGDHPLAYQMTQRIQDLSVSLQISQQAIPTIELLKMNSEDLLSRINMVLDNTIPVWQQNMLQTISIWRQKRVSDSTSELHQVSSKMEDSVERLERNASAVRKEMSRGVYDLDTVKRANDELVLAITEGRELVESVTQVGQQLDARVQEI